MIKHFWKRTRLFVLIILIGILGLIVINQYDTTEYAGTQTPVEEAECTGTFC